MENGIMSIEEIKAKVKQPLKGLTGVRFLAENFTTLSFRQGDIASVKLHKLIPSCPDSLTLVLHLSFPAILRRTMRESGSVPVQII